VVVVVADAATTAAAAAAAGSRVSRPAAYERHGLLERAAHAEGNAWASWWRNELCRQSRPVAGGWPGTLTEARMRVARRIAVDLGPDFGATAQELEEAARSAYGAARREWKLNCEPEATEHDGLD